MTSYEGQLLTRLRELGGTATLRELAAAYVRATGKGTSLLSASGSLTRLQRAGQVTMTRSADGLETIWTLARTTSRAG